MNNLRLNAEQLRALYRSDLNSFIQMSMGVLEPNTVFLPNWHIEVIADRLKKCYEGKIKRLIINLPPRYLKSICASVAFPAWVFSKDPTKQIMCVSYGDELVKELGEKTRRLMSSPKYRSLFSYAQLSSLNPAANKLKTLGGGSRIGIAAGGPITGRGADIIILDDPLKASDARTQKLVQTNTWYDDNTYQRLNNKNEGVIIVIMQRLHEYDLTGHLLGREEHWEVLDLKAIAEEDEVYMIERLGRSHSLGRKEGEPLHPGIESRELLIQQKANLGSFVFAAQYQQSPAADTESIIREGWFQQYPLDVWQQSLNAQSYRLYHQLGFHTILQSWDTALTASESSDYSCCVTIGIKEGRFYVLDVFRKKITFSELATQVDVKRREFGADRVIIEDSSAGKNLIEFLRSKNMAIETFRPDGDKYSRLNSVSGYVESGLVYLPEKAEWLADFVLEVTRFPNSRNDDQVDAFSQCMLVARDAQTPEIWVM